MDRGPIPGWAPADERSLTGDAARRPVGAVVGEAFGLYRRHARPLLLMTAALDVPATLLALPYLVLTLVGARRVPGIAALDRRASGA